MVLNGDMLNDFNYTKFLQTHVPGTPRIVGAWEKDARDFGLLDVEGDRIRAFREKPKEAESGYINAGCYILNNAHLAGVPGPAFMIEQKVFPRLAAAGELRVFLHKGFCRDAGTEDRLAEVRETLA